MFVLCLLIRREIITKRAIYKRKRSRFISLESVETEKKWMNYYRRSVITLCRIYTQATSTIHSDTFTPAQAHPHTHTHAHTQTRAHTNPCLNIRTCTHKCTLMRAPMYIYIYTHTHTCTVAHAHTHTHTHHDSYQEANTNVDNVNNLKMHVGKITFRFRILAIN